MLLWHKVTCNRILLQHSAMRPEREDLQQQTVSLLAYYDLTLSDKSLVLMLCAVSSKSLYIRTTDGRNSISDTNLTSFVNSSKKTNLQSAEVRLERKTDSNALSLPQSLQQLVTNKSTLNHYHHHHAYISTRMDG